MQLLETSRVQARCLQGGDASVLEDKTSTKSFMGVVALGWLALAIAWPQPGKAQDPAANAVVVLDVSGPIGPGTTEYVRHGFAEAARTNAVLIVVKLNTPGGLVSSMRDIVMAILASQVPVATFVTPPGARAASAGTYIVYASHLAAMAPSTHLGAATPVSLGGGGTPADDQKDSTGSKSGVQNKAVNDAAASIRGLAKLRGRDQTFAERAVREAATLTAHEAREQGVVEIVAQDMADLLRQANGRSLRMQDREVRLALADAQLVELEPDWRARILSTITNPTIAYVLLLAGLYGLLFEFISPGAVFPGVVGAIALLVALYALNLLPISYAGAGLLLVGIALMTAEAFLPSFGVLGVGGFAAFALGSLFLLPREVPGFHLPLPVIAVASIASAAFLLVALAAAWAAHRRSVTTGDAVLLGSPGRVLAWNGGEGDVQVNGERWHARSAVPLAQGERVRVLERRDLVLIVEPDPDPAATR